MKVWGSSSRIISRTLDGLSSSGGDSLLEGLDGRLRAVRRRRQQHSKAIRRVKRSSAIGTVIAIIAPVPKPPRDEPDTGSMIEVEPGVEATEVLGDDLVVDVEGRVVLLLSPTTSFIDCELAEFEDVEVARTVNPISDGSTSSGTSPERMKVCPSRKIQVALFGASRSNSTSDGFSR